MATRKSWTKEEDEILVQAIKANPHNKAKAFKEVAEKVNHNINSCSTRWYRVLSNPENKKYVGTLCTLVGNKSKFDNRSVYREKSHTKPQKQKGNLWSKIKSLLNIK